MSVHRLRLAAAAVLTSLVAATTAVTVTATPAQAQECNINNPGNVCYSAYVLVTELVDNLRDVAEQVVDNVLDEARDCLQGEPGTACGQVDEIVQALIALGGQVLAILLDAVEDARALADQVIATVLLIVNDQVAQLKAIADEVAGPYVALVEGLVADLTALVTKSVPTRYSVKTSSHPGTGYRTDIARACTATTDKPLPGAVTSQTITVAGAATATTAPTSGATVTRFTKLQCVVLRATPNGPVTLATFERQLANPFSAVNGSAVVSAGDFYVCPRGEVTLTNNAVVTFADC